MASSEIARLDRLVADLLVVAGGASGPKSAGSLGDLARARSGGRFRPWAHERGIELVVEGDARAELESDAVARAIDNLFRNAVEASPRGARVLVRVSGDASSGKAELDVEDAGTGVPPRAGVGALRAVLHHQGRRKRSRSRALPLHRAVARWGTSCTCGRVGAPTSSSRSEVRSRPRIR